MSGDTRGVEEIEIDENVVDRAEHRHAPGSLGGFGELPGKGLNRVVLRLPGGIAHPGRHVLQHAAFCIGGIDEIYEILHVCGRARGETCGELGVHVGPVVGGELNFGVWVGFLEVVNDLGLVFGLVRRVRPLDHRDLAGKPGCARRPGAHQIGNSGRTSEQVQEPAPVHAALICR